MTPSFAVLQDVNITRRATLEEDPAIIEQVCQEKRKDGPGQLCFKYVGNFTHGANNSHLMRYAIFDGHRYPSFNITDSLDLWYLYSCLYLPFTSASAPILTNDPLDNGSVSHDPLLSVAIFHRDLVPDFVFAYKVCLVSYRALNLFTSVADPEFSAASSAQPSFQQKNVFKSTCSKTRFMMTTTS